MAYFLPFSNIISIKTQKKLQYGIRRWRHCKSSKSTSVLKELMHYIPINIESIALWGTRLS
jgi:hypothetical protein